jgi:aminoglycoside phosphotransferase (APT) family kinase protein
MNEKRILMTLHDFINMTGLKEYTSIEKIDLGWSSDEKYLLTLKDGKHHLLRLSNIKYFDIKEKEFEVIKLFSRLGFLMSMPVAFGKTNDFLQCYMILTYIEGKTLEDSLPSLSSDIQYDLGIKAGHILKGIHNIDVPKSFNQHKNIKEKKLKQLHLYEISNNRMPDDEDVISFIKTNIDMIGRNTHSFQHGDFHPGNLILTDDMDLGVIDFNRWDVNDPYEEFYKVTYFSANISPYFAKGQIDGYFDHQVPLEFWKTLAVYSAHATLYSIKWAEPYGEKDVNNMKTYYHKMMFHYNGFKNDIPKWYVDLS